MGLKITSSIPVRSTKKEKVNVVKGLRNQAFRNNSQIERTRERTLKKKENHLLEEFKNKFQQMNTLLPYKPARLYTAGNNVKEQWHVEYSYLIPGTIDKYKRFKQYFNLNKMKADHGLQVALLYGDEMCKFLNEKLNAGYNPFDDINLQAKTGVNIQSQLYILLTEITRDVTKSKKASYQEHYNRFIKFIETESLQKFNAGLIKPKDAVSYRTFLTKNKLSAKTINASLSYMEKFFDKAFDKGWILSNPFKSVPRISKRDVPRQQSQERFEPLTDGELKKLFDELRKAGEHNFIAFLSFIYYAWARPIEITRLRICDIDIERMVVRFRKTETKNDKGAYVQIVPPLLEILKTLNLNKYPADYILFSTIDFKPGKFKQQKNNSSKYWKNHVKDNPKIAIQKDMYGLKHTGNIEYLLNNKGNVDLKWQQMQNRHSSSTMTDRYNRKLGAYFIEVKNLVYRTL